MPLSNEEKQIVKEMKSQLKMMGVPRDNWAKMIQDEISRQRKASGGKKKKRGKISSFFHRIFTRIKKMFSTVFTRLMLKRQGIDMDNKQLNEMADIMMGNKGIEDMDSDTMAEMMSSMMGPQMGGISQPNSKSIQDIQRKGTVLSDKQKKKKKIIDIEFEEDEEDDHKDSKVGKNGKDGEGGKDGDSIDEYTEDEVDSFTYY